MEAFGAKQTGPKQTASELVSSAKEAAGAAQSAISRETDKLPDKAKVADSAEDLLQSAAQRGNLDKDKGVGQYVDKAEKYVHQYGSNAEPPKDQPPPSGEGKPGDGLGGIVNAAKGLFN